MKIFGSNHFLHSTFFLFWIFNFHFLNVLASPDPSSRYKHSFDRAVNSLFKGNYDESLNLFQKLSKEKSSDSIMVANVLANIGTINVQLSLYDKAIEFYLKAEAIYSRRGNDELIKLASIQVNLANCYFKNNDMEKARSYYENADRIFKQLKYMDSYEYESLLNNFSSFYAANLNYSKALEYNNMSFHISTKDLKEFTKWNFRGYIFYKKGNFSESVNCYNTALKVMERDHGKNYSGKEQIFNNLGQVYMELNEFDKAYDNFEKARKQILLTSGNSNAIYSSSLNRIGQVYQKRSNTTADLNQFLDQREENILTALQYYQQALCCITPGYSDLKISENPLLENTIDKTQFLITLKNKAEALCELSELKEKKGDTKGCIDFLRGALKVYELSNKLIHLIRTGFINQESRLFLAENEHSYYLGAIDAAMKLFELTKERKHFEQAFEFSERSRSTDFLTMVKNLQAKQFGGIPDSLFQRETELKSEIAAYKNFVFIEDSEKEKDLNKINLWKSKIFTLEQRYAKLINLLESQYPKYYRFKYTNPVVSVSEIQEKLKQREAFVEYVVREPDAKHKGKITIFLVKKNEYRVYEQNLDTLYQNSINTVLKFLKNGSVYNTRKNDYQAYAINAHNLYNLLIAPFASQVKGHRLIIVPDGKLSYLPFDSFITATPDITKMDFGHLKYLVYDHAVSYSYSATLLYHYFNNHKTATRELGAFIPEYKMKTELVNEDESPLPLPGAKLEVEKISRLFGSSVFSGDKATKGNFLTEARKFDILHLAMHTIINDSLPMYSKLLFSPRNRNSDTDLYTYEIYNMNIKSRLTVLSACNTGSGKLAKGEGVMSLARAFLYAGCPSIVMTLWSVEDESSAKIMVNFYQYLLKGYAKDEALRKAKIKHILSADPLHAHPYYWLGYVSIGDQNSINHTKTIYFLVVIFFILVVILAERTFSYLKNKKLK